MSRILTILLLSIWASHALAQEQPTAQPRRWAFSLGGGYQAASQPQRLQRFTDALVGHPSSGLVWAFELGYFWNLRWGAFAAARFSQTPADWPNALQQALERNYPGKLVRIALGKGGGWDGAVSQAMFGVRRRFFFQKMSLLPSLAIGFTEVQISDGAADLKTPNSHALSNVFAYNMEQGPWLTSFALDAGGRAEWPLGRRFYATLSAHYCWTQPKAVFHFYEVDQVAGTLRYEQLRYERAQHQVLLTAGLSWQFGKTRK